MQVNYAGTVIALVAGLELGAGACGSSSGSGGDVMLTVTLPEGVQVKTAGYTLDDKAHPALHGVVGGPQPQHQVVETIGDVPASDNYVMTIQAESSDGQMICGGSTPVKVMSGVTTRAQVTLTCGGRVTVGIGVSCLDAPLVDFLVSALEAHVGGSVLARAAPTSPDGGALTFGWSAPSGSFADPSASQTSFTCAQAGPVTLTVKVEDADMCQQSYSAVVTCLDVPDAGPG